MAFYEQFVSERGGLPKDTLGVRMEALRLTLKDVCNHLPNVDDSSEKIYRCYFGSRLSDEEIEAFTEDTRNSKIINPELKLLSRNSVVKVNTELFHPMGKPKNCLQLKSVEARLLQRADLQETASKYRSTIWVAVQEKGSPDLTPLKDSVVYVKVYYPFRHSPIIRVQKRLRCAQEVVFLLKQPLTKLRDMIQCDCDGFILNEMSEKPVPVPTPKAVDVYPSGCFFIGRTFYNDMRKPNSIDYSKNIMKWLQDKGIGNYDTKDMAETKFEDLTVLLGAPGVYIHQGNCEHVIVISDVKLLHRQDILKSATYPYIHSIGYNQSIYCDICAVHIAKWLTLDHEKLAYNPAYFCGPCFVSYNYIDGAKCYKFKAYPMQGPVNDSEKCLKQFLHSRKLNLDSKLQKKSRRKNSSILGTFFLLDAPGMQTATIYPDSDEGESTTSSVHKSNTENGIETICIDDTNEEQSTPDAALQNVSLNVENTNPSSGKSDPSLHDYTTPTNKLASISSTSKDSASDVLVKTTNAVSTDNGTATNQETSENSQMDISSASTSEIENEKHINLERNPSRSMESSDKESDSGNPLLVIIDAQGEVKVQDLPKTIKEVKAQNLPKAIKEVNAQVHPETIEEVNEEDLPMTIIEVNVQDHQKTMKEINVQDCPKTVKKVNVQDYPKTMKEVNVQDHPKTIEEVNEEDLPMTIMEVSVQDHPKTIKNVKSQNLQKTIKKINAQDPPKTTKQVNVQDHPKTIKEVNVQVHENTMEEVNVQDRPKTVKKVNVQDHPKTIKKVKTQNLPKTIKEVKAKDHPKTNKEVTTQNIPKTIKEANAQDHPKTIEQENVQNDPKTIWEVNVQDHPKTMKELNVQDRPMTIKELTTFKK